MTSRRFVTSWRRALGLAVVAGTVVTAVVVHRVSTPPALLLPMPESVAPPAPASEPSDGSLLAEVLAAHGGIHQWRKYGRVKARLRFGGWAFRLRFAEPSPEFRDVELELRRPWLCISDFPSRGRRGVFTPEKVWIEDAAGRVVEELSDPRQKLLHSRWAQLWWNDLELLYFAGYALWNYLQGPFLLLQDGVESREVEPWSGDGVSWRRLAVKFHPSVPTHSSEQIFYFDESFRQRRHDYVPQVFAAWARAAHFTGEYREFSGIQFPTRRRVLPPGRSGPLLVSIEIIDVQLTP